jgi:hypothetical protein
MPLVIITLHWKWADLCQPCSYETLPRLWPSNALQWIVRHWTPSGVIRLGCWAESRLLGTHTQKVILIRPRCGNEVLENHQKVHDSMLAIQRKQIHARPRRLYICLACVSMPGITQFQAGHGVSLVGTWLLLSLPSEA